MSLEDEAPVLPTPTDAAAALPGSEAPLLEASARPEFEDFPEELRPKIDHLIFDDGEAVESTFFERLMRLLVGTLYASWSGPGEGRTWAAFSNVGLFWEPKQTPLVPDVMLSLDVEIGRNAITEREKLSYLMWILGKPPDVVIELVSDKRGGEATHKMRKYAKLGIAYYVIFDPYNALKAGELRVFRLVGRSYEPIDPSWLPDIRLGLVVWQGTYQGLSARYLRWCDRDGKLLPTPEEAQDRERQRAETERLRAERAEEEARRLAEKLRALGIDPSSPEGR